MTRPEDDVALRLERALHAGLDDTHVDVGRLAARTRTGVRRAAVRRTVATAAAAVAVVAIPVAVAAGPFTGALGAPASEGGLPSPSPTVSAPQDPSPTPSASDSGPVPAPTAATSEPAPDVVVSPEPEPTGTPPTTVEIVPWQEVAVSEDYNLVAYRVPPEVFPTDAELPRPMEQMFTAEDYGGIPQVQGQTCNRPQVFPRPIAGSAVSWADAKDYEALSIDVNVTGWEPGTGAERFAEIVDDSSRVCAFDQPFRAASTDGMTAGDERFAATMTGNHAADGWASVRVGDVVVSVSVMHEDGPRAAVRIARDLADGVAYRVKSTGLDAVGRAGGAG